MKIVFFGTPEYVLPILKNLPKPVAVVTQPPKEVGRKKFITRSPVDNWAYKRKIPVIYDLNKIPRADLGILAAYGKIIPKFIIGHLKFGILNVHPSLLPRWRGASPVQATIAMGEKETGVTIIKLDEEIDHGPIISQFTEEVRLLDTLGSLRERLFEKSAEVLAALIEPYSKGKITPRRQDDSLATFTRRVTKEDGFIPPEYFATTLQGSTFECRWRADFMKDNSHNPLFLIPDSPALDRFIRAMDPWPGAWTLLRLGGSSGQAKRLKILKAHLEKQQSVNSKQLTVRLVPELVQLESKNPVSWKQFTQSCPLGTIRYRSLLTKR